MTMKVLYVEDNIFSVNLIKLCLQKRPDYELIVAYDGTTAWEKIFIHQPDLILMDINLPDTNGWVLSRRLRENYITKDIPIIAVTSLNQHNNCTESKDAGINLHLSKSMVHKLLIRHMDTLLSNRSA